MTSMYWKTFIAVGLATGLTAGIFAAPAHADQRWDTCRHFGRVHSINSDVPVTVTFRNMTDSYRSVMWIGFDGVPKNYANLNPGQEFTVNTFLTHPWMFTDGPGNCVEMFMPRKGVSRFNIMRKSTGTGGD